MILYPAIDIRGGRAVRLLRGDYGRETTYDADPAEAAARWASEGAEFLHVVDLDGAKSGAPVNLEHLRRIVHELAVPVQFGGGLRSAQAVTAALDAGAHRVILGTAAFTDPDLLRRVLDAHGPSRVLVSVDVRGGHVSTAGWTQTTELSTAAVLERLHEAGVRNLVYTNVDRDGMLEGPDLQEVAEVVVAAQGSVVYSGGIGALADLEGLAALQQPKLAGVIVGKALYEGRFTVAEARAALGD